MTLARDTDHIETDRLILRRMTPTDLDYYTALHLDLEVTRFINQGRVRSPEETADWLEYALTTYEAFALGQLAVVLKSSGELLGRCGLSDFAIEAEPAPGAVPKAWFRRAQAPAGIKLTLAPELGYTFARNSWGHGYAREAAGCVYNYGRDVLRLPRIVSIIHPENVRSQKLARGFGVQPDGDVEVVGQVTNLYVWPKAASAGPA